MRHGYRVCSTRGRSVCPGRHRQRRNSGVDEAQALRRALSRLAVGCTLLAVLVSMAAPALGAPSSAAERQGTIHIVQWGRT